MKQASNKHKHYSDSTLVDQDPTAAARKHDHIQLAFEAQVQANLLDQRFYYEPLLAPHPGENSLKSIEFLGKNMRAPLWVSSMTGGTQLARTINHRLAKACQEFGMGMGLGSCRSLLYSDDTLDDFNVRPLIGDTLPLYTNLGIAQVEQLIQAKELFLIPELIDKLQADGLIIHINPLQEWLQPEGDRFKVAPLETIETVLGKLSIPIIVKEVGQGFGYQSMKALLQLPLAAIDFAANGGTNFARLELMRSDEQKQSIYKELAYVGHSAEEMVLITNRLVEELGEKCQCKQIIVSGGIQNFLDGYYLTNKIQLPAIYGQASGFLKYAQTSYEVLRQYIETQIRGLELAHAFLTIK